ncbi:10962_t:CDS:1, partial [Paraglomus brasilianum]
QLVADTIGEDTRRIVARGGHDRRELPIAGRPMRWARDLFPESDTQEEEERLFSPVESIPDEGGYSS